MSRNTAKLGTCSVWERRLQLRSEVKWRELDERTQLPRVSCFWGGRGADRQKLLSIFVGERPHPYVFGKVGKQGRRSQFFFAPPSVGGRRAVPINEWVRPRSKVGGSARHESPTFATEAVKKTVSSGGWAEEMQNVLHRGLMELNRCGEVGVLHGTLARW